MKKLITICLLFALALACAACGGAPAQAPSGQTGADPATAQEELQAWMEETEGTNVEKTLHLSINDREVSVAWEDNETVDALAQLVSSAPLRVEMSLYGGFEQVGPLGTSLPRNDSQTDTQAGDIVLYAGDQLVIFYDSHSWDYTRLGRITDPSAEELRDLLGSDDVRVTLCWE